MKRFCGLRAEHRQTAKTEVVSITTTSVSCVKKRKNTVKQHFSEVLRNCVGTVSKGEHAMKQTKKKTKSNNRRSRKYQLTFNNSDKHKNCSHEAIKKALNHWDNILYWCMCDEIGKEGTLHTHLYIQFKNPIYFSAIKSMFETAHIEEAEGTAEENRVYIRKEGKWEGTEKEETNLKETFEEFGTIPKGGQGRRSDLANLYQMIKDGCTNVEILEMNPDNILNLQHIDKARLEILSNRYRAERRTDLLVTYVQGMTGLGKSRLILDEHGDENVYRVTDYKHPFDSYAGEDVIVLEEFRSDFTIGNILNYLDIYPIQLPARYNNRQACYNFVYIVSNWRLEDQYHNIKIEQPETYQAFLRRIKKVRVYTAPNTYEEYDTWEYLYGFRRIGDKEHPFQQEETEE